MSNSIRNFKRLKCSSLHSSSARQTRCQAVGHWVASVSNFPLVAVQRHDVRQPLRFLFCRKESHDEAARALNTLHQQIEVCALFAPTSPNAMRALRPARRRGSGDEETLASQAPTAVSEFARSRLSDDRGAQDEACRVGVSAHNPGTFGRFYNTHQYQSKLKSCSTWARST